jgi:hypothetical protein
MSHYTIPHKPTATPHVWLCISMALGLALASQPTAATECQRQTPLPADVRLIAPGPEACKRSCARWTQSLCVSHRNLLLRMA